MVTHNPGGSLLLQFQGYSVCLKTVDQVKNHLIMLWLWKKYVYTEQAVTKVMDKWLQNSR